VIVRSLATGAPAYPREVARVELLGHRGPLSFTRGDTGLVVTMPETKHNEYAYGLKIIPG
jgi:hypothetical protein